VVSLPPQLLYPSSYPHNRRLDGRFGKGKTLAPAANRMLAGAVTVPTAYRVRVGCGRMGIKHVMVEIRVAGRLHLHRDFLPSSAH
jgi:hypothetical protein